MGQIVPVRGVKVAWARYEDKYHAPPASVIVQISDTGGDGPWKDVLTIGADKIPADEAPFESDRSWAYPFPEAASGGFMRLFFPEGDQPQAKYDGYICLGEVQIDSPGLAPQLVSIEGVFGKVEVERHVALMHAAVRSRAWGELGLGIIAGRQWPTPLGQGRLHLRGGRGWETIRELAGQAGQDGGRSGGRSQRAPCVPA